MHKRTQKQAIVAGILLVATLAVCCGQSANRQVGERFIAGFEKIEEQNKALEALEKQAEQYREQLDKALQEPTATKRAMAFGAWVAQSKAMLSQARSMVEAESNLLSGMVADSARFTGEANRYAREATDALREYVEDQRKSAEIGDELIATIESYIEKPADANPDRLEQLVKAGEDLDSKAKKTFQQAQDAITRLRAVAL